MTKTVQVAIIHIMKLHLQANLTGACPKSRKSNFLSITVTIALLATGAVWPVGAGVLPKQTVAYQGQAAPGAGVSAIFSGFDEAPVVGSDGSVAFTAKVTGGSAVSGLWLGLPPGAMAPVGLLAQPINDGSGLAWSSFVSYPLARLDLIGILGWIATNTTDNEAVWTGSTTGLVRALREGLQAPGLTGGVLFAGPVTSLGMTDSGRLAFTAFLRGTGVSTANDESLWMGPPGALTLAAREGSVAPGAGGATFAGLGSPLVNDSGQIAFLGNLQGAGVTVFNAFGLWLGAPGGLNLVARANELAGTTGYRFDSMQVGAMNNAGQFAFQARLRNDTFDVVASTLWRADAGGLTLMARSGDAAPGLPEGTFFSNLHRAPSLLSQGEIVFEAYLSGGGTTSGNDYSIWAGSPGNYRLLFREGMAAPAVDGAQFRELTVRPLVNGNGRIAIFAGITGSGINTTNDFGLWAMDPLGRFRLVVREGDELEVAPGDRRIVSSIPFVSGQGQGEDGRARSLNNCGRLAFRVQFSDGTKAILLAGPGPEPVLERIRYQGASVEMDFFGLTGKTYVLESKDSPYAAGWDAGQSGMPGNCGTATARDDSTAGVTQRWYRIRQE